MSELPQRKRLRLENADYGEARCYFLTVCIQDRVKLLSEIEGSINQFLPAGEMVNVWINKLPEKCPTIDLEEYIIMPNHIHLLLGIDEKTNHTIPVIMDWFKTMTTNAFIKAVRQDNWPRYDSRFWQRGYHDRIVRNRDEHERIG